MADEFMESLLLAVGAFVGVVVDAPASTGIGVGPSTWAPTAGRLGTGIPKFDVPENHGIAGIRAADPAFEIGAFLVHIGQMFSAYHEAVDRGDLKPARRFIDEAAYAELAKAAEKTGRRPDGPRSLKVRAIRPETAVHQDGLDLVRILITADVAGQRDVMCEYWEVIRKHGTVTKAGLDLTHCPNCGAPITGDDPTRCAYCGERLADPALDWVVRKIMVQ
jgi:hypothetical protein